MKRRKRLLTMLICLEFACIGFNGCGEYNPCKSDPCLSIQDAVSGTCEADEEFTFSCKCELKYEWDNNVQECIEIDPCESDPCLSIQDAVSGTCEADEEFIYSCECESEYVWDDDSLSCLDPYPCDPDPCDDIRNATDGSCNDAGDEDYTCECELGYVWDNNVQECTEIDPCDPDPCDGINDAIADTCTKSSYDDYICECNGDFIWDSGLNSCQDIPHLGELCGSCSATFCQRGGTGICPDSDLEMPCIGAGTGMYCSESCESDADCQNSLTPMLCLMSCPYKPTVAGRCWEANQAAWMESVVCPNN